MDGSVIRSHFAGHPDRSAHTRHALRLKLDHSTGTGHSGGTFGNARGTALHLHAAAIAGSFFFRELRTFHGFLDLTTATIGALVDDVASWPKGQVILDDLTYSRLAGTTATDAATRITWLDKQVPDHLGAEFRPQPCGNSAPPRGEILLAFSTSRHR